jgi:hypothetical protein
VIFTRPHYAQKVVEITGMKLVPKTETGPMKGQTAWSINAEISPT